MFKTIITKSSKLNYLKRHFNSALFISRDKAQETFSVLTPHIDFDEQLKNKNNIIENLKLRHSDANLDEIISMWIFYKKFLTKKAELEQSKAIIGKTIKTLSPEKDKDEIDKLITHGKMIKDDLKSLRDSFYSVEENAIVKVLSLPNVIHEKTPLNDFKIIYKNELPKNSSTHHLQIGDRLNLIEMSNNSSYYLKNDAALFELGSTFFFADKLLQNNFTEFSNSDFSRSVVVEGCGIDFNDQNKVFTIMETDSDTKHSNSRTHLTGGGSITSFMSYFTKHVVFPSHLPLKLFTIGRKYTPNNSKEVSLLNVTQETCVNFFIATKDDLNDMNYELDNFIKYIIEIYEILGYDFRLSYLPANKLENYESLRVCIELYSSYLQKYVEIGYVSVLDNYVSKRLLFNYGTGFNMNFPKVLSGTLFSVPKILACILENNHLLLHDEFKKYFS